MGKKKRILGERKAAPTATGTSGASTSAGTSGASTSASASTSGGFQGSLNEELAAMYRQACQRPRKLRRAAFYSLMNKMDQVRSVDNLKANLKARLTSIANAQKFLEDPVELQFNLSIWRLREICLEVLVLLRFLQNSAGLTLHKKLKVRTLSKKLAVKKKPRKVLVMKKIFGLNAYLKFVLKDIHRYFEELKMLPYFKVANVLDYGMWLVLKDHLNYDGNVIFVGVEPKLIRKDWEKVLKRKP